MDQSVKATIFGVGRSGTKAVQIKIAWLLAKKNGEVFLQYEPYFHLSRKGPRSYLGIREHRNSPLVMAPDESLSRSHLEFIKGLKPKQNIPLVAKFIHGNGRINQINRVIKPDFSILVVRDLYQVLSSIIRMNWDFYRFGSGYMPLTSVNFLKELLRDAKKNDLLNGNLISIAKNLKSSDRIMCNAMYWYILNKSALMFKEDDKTIAFNYDDMDELPASLAKKLPSHIFTKEELMTIPDFAGNLIHQNYPLENITEVFKRKRKRNIVNEASFCLLQRSMKAFPVPVNRKGGELLVLTDANLPEVASTVRQSHKMIIQQSSILDDMNSEVMELLNRLQQ